MPKTIEAIYENGILRPIASLKLKEHQLVKITFVPAEIKEIPPMVKRIIDHLSAPLPARSSDDIIQDTQIDAD